DVKLNNFDDIDAISQRVIDEYNLDCKLSDMRLYASLMLDSHTSSGIQAYYYFGFIFDDLMIFKGIDYIDVIKGLEGRENNLPPLVSEILSIYMKHWKKDFKNKYSLLRTELITWVATVNQQLQASFNQNEYFVFKLKCHGSYLALIMMFLVRDVNCTYLEYRTLQTTFEMLMFYTNELASCLQEKDAGELTSVDKLFMTNDFSRISEYCVKQIYKTMKEFEGKCNLMVSLEFLRQYWYLLYSIKLNFICALSKNIDDETVNGYFMLEV
ncbi:3737_t:CDS:2, partial [Gigaspora rosea]